MLKTMKHALALALLCLLPFAKATAQDAQSLHDRMQQRAMSVIAQMTVEEKIAQLMNDAPGIDRLGIMPYNWWNEALHGVARNGKATVFPQPIGLGATFDTALVHRVADAIATEGRAKFNAAQTIGNHAIYAGLTYWSPNVNIFRDPRWGRGMETFGEDPFLSGRIGSAFVKGLQGDHPFYLKAAACAKHFAVHSGPEKFRHTFDVHPSDRDLYETYLPAFKMLVEEARVEAVMGAYNRVRGESASGSLFLLTDLLRGEWGFRGHVVSDCDAVKDIYQGHHIADSKAEAAALALKSGMNLNCGTTFRALKDAYEEGLVTEADLDAALLPLIMTRLKLGILTADDYSPYADVPDTVVACRAHAALAREAARKSMVLLKNDGVLPLDKDMRSLYVLGPNATDAFALMGNYFGVANHYSTYLQGIVDKVGNGTSINYKLGFIAEIPNVNRRDWALGEARRSEVCIVVMGNTGATEGEEGDAIASPEMGDKSSLSLPEHQIEFLRKLRQNNSNKIITVLTGGSPIDVAEIAQLSDAMVMVWYAGQEGGAALGDLLFGDASFSGRLPVTFPLAVDSLPAFEDYTMDGRTYKYMKGNVMYPFGYGLTYSRVEYEGASVSGVRAKGKEPLEIQATLRNTGDAAVEEVAQLYLSTPGAGIETPIASLIGFQRVTLPAHTSYTVRFEVQPDQLQSVCTDGIRRLLKGTYTLTVSGAAPGTRSDELGVSKSTVEFKL